MTYAFILGNTPDLSIAEIESIIPSCPEKRLADGILELSSDGICPDKLINRLGGTVKIAEYLDEISDIDGYDFTLCFASDIRKIDFGISQYNLNLNLKSLLTQIKKNLGEKNIKSRFVLSKENTLSSVVVKKQKLFELILIKSENKYKIYKTLVVQDFEDWNKRDYNRPSVNPKKGMLPPKVARMMVNLVPGREGLLLDPFCGVGTILAEGLMMGLSVLGNDISAEAVESSRKNLDWLSKEYNTSGKYNIFESDAKNLTDKIQKETISAVVTEPYMGPLTPSKDIIGNIIKELEQLYIGCLRNWHGLIKNNGTVVIIFPHFNIEGLEFSIKSPIDKLNELGYTLLRGPITYSRPQAIVKRNIYVLKKQ